MTTIVLSGPSGSLTRRVRRRLAAEDGLDVVVVDHHDVKARMEGADAVVHLGDDVEATRDVLDAAGSVGAKTVVLLSSATVYGAWPSNPVPLTEDAPLRPNADLEFAVHAAERERLAVEWKGDHPGTTVAILRPAVAVAEDEPGWLARALRAIAAVRPAGVDDPPAQYVHLDDVADAVVVAMRARLDGPFNVAPDGWMSGESVRALAGVPSVRVPGRVARRVAWARWKLGLAPTHPGLLPYAEHPWVVANDRLKAAGWRPTSTNEEAYVAAHPPTPWATVSPQRRQELALGWLAAAVVGAATGAVLLVRRLRRRAG